MRSLKLTYEVLFFPCNSSIAHIQCFCTIIFQPFLLLTMWGFFFHKKVCGMQVLSSSDLLGICLHSFTLCHQLFQYNLLNSFWSCRQCVRQVPSALFCNLLTYQQRGRAACQQLQGRSSLLPKTESTKSKGCQCG